MSAAVQQPEDPAVAAACERMHQRLICWGRLVLAGGDGRRPREKWDSDQDVFYDYRPAHYDDAHKVIGPMVLQLPKPQQRLVLAQFYVSDRVSLVWYDLSEDRRQHIAATIAEAVNYRLRAMNAELGTDWMPILARDMDAIRLRAIRALVNREATTA